MTGHPGDPYNETSKISAKEIPHWHTFMPKNVGGKEETMFWNEKPYHSLDYEMKKNNTDKKSINWLLTAA